jgi:hypothetical protein
MWSWYFKVYLKELVSNKLVQWKSIGYEVLKKTDDGRDKKVQKLEYHESQPKALLDYLKSRLKEFVLHNYVVKWQETQFE